MSTDQERFEAAREIFDELVDLPPDQRTAKLEELCADDPALRAEVEGLLAHAETAPLASGPGGTDSVPAGQQIGAYRVLRSLGTGGMGAVYLAEQEHPRRTVALKLIRPGLATPDLLRRFEHEAQVLGRLQHPGIAQIYEAGTADSGHGPQPFFAMELVKGVRLTEYAEANTLGTLRRLELFGKVCDAVHHAHQKGVIHRDLKPGNILVTDDGQPKVLDFGVARETDSDIQTTTLQTDIGQLIGTIPYMSPEQVAGDPDELDTRSDVYALGVVAYELLAGRLPYDVRDKMIPEAVRIIRDEDPTPLSSVNKVFRGDVETIIAKTLEKDRSRRYQSASDLASDIRRYLSDEPIVARPASTMYQLRKFAKRNKALVGGVAAVFIVLVLGVIGTSIGLAQAVHARDAEARQRRVAEAAEREQNRARKEAEQARDQLRIVVDFQSSMLGETDGEQMGRGIVADIRDGIREVLEARKASAEDIENALASFDESLKGVNTTNVAPKVIDEHVLSRAVETIAKDFADQALVRASLQQTVADTYREIGLYPPALPLQEAALETRRAELGDDHPDTLTSINNMGHLLYSMGKLAEVEPYYREALEGRRRVLGDDRPNTLISINNMGALLQSMGKFAEAEPYCREALEGYRRVLGEDHPDTLTSINTMGTLLYSMGKLAEVEPYYREALEGRRRVLGDDHPHTLTSINNMGYLLESMGKLAEAEPYYREALEGRRRVLGDDHPDTLTSINNMGYLLQKMGKLAEAEPYYREALEGFRRVLGDDHPNTLGSISNMGALLQSMGKLAEAEPYHREALEGRRRFLGDDHPGTLMSIRHVGFLLMSMGKHAEAEPYYREALEGSRRVLGDDHPHTLGSISNMGGLLYSMGKLAEAEPYHREALEGRRRVLGDDHPGTLISINTMGFLLRSMGKLAAAEPYYREALEARRRVLGDDHPDTLISIHNMGGLLRDLGRLEEAESLGAEAVRGATARFPASHRFRLAALHQHGRTLAAMKRYADAEAELLAAQEGLSNTLGIDHKQTRGNIEAVIDLYTTWHEAEPDQGYDAKAAEWRAKLEQWQATTQPALAQTQPTPSDDRQENEP